MKVVVGPPCLWNGESIPIPAWFLTWTCEVHCTCFPGTFRNKNGLFSSYAGLVWMCILLLLLVENPTLSFELSYHCGPNSWIIRRIRSITTAGATTNLNILDWVWPFTPLAINKSLIQTRLVVWKWKIFTSYYWLSRPCHFLEMGLGLIFTGKGRCSGIFESWTFNLGTPPLFTIRAPSRRN